MACQPGSQLYDCTRQDSTNLGVFSVSEGQVVEVTSEGLADGQTIPILVRDENGEYVPYLIDGEQVVLSEENPSVIITEEGYYQLDTSAIVCPETGITVTAEPLDSDISTSVTACYTDEAGVSTAVEIIRYGDSDTPVVYELGTGIRISDTSGTFAQSCCECEGGDVTPIQVISETEQLGCVVEPTSGEVTGKVYFVPTFDVDGNMTSNRMIMVATDGTVTDPYTGSWENCGDSECTTCETLVLCDTVNNPDPAEGTPWNVVEIEEDADDPEHILHFHMSPADDPTKVGIVTFQSSTPFNTGGCDNPEVDYAISNPSRRTITLDEVAQEMHAFQFNMIDFDTFEPTYIPTGYPIPTRLGGTAYWTGEPGNNVNILPTESNGTGQLIWDNPPETMAIQVGNTGGGISCSNVDFEALTLSTMNRPFLRTICRDCEGNIVSITDTDMDGVTPYEPVGEVTVCLASGEDQDNSQIQEQWTTVNPISVATPRGTIQRLDSSELGAIPSGMESVTITNVGDAIGTVDGASIYPGQTVTITAYQDPETREFVRLEGFGYDGTGTILSITVLV